MRKIYPLFVFTITASAVGCSAQPTGTGAAPTPAKPGAEAERETPPQPSLPKSSEAPKVDDPPPELTFNATDYTTEHRKDEVRTEQKYTRKRVEVTGIVRGVEWDARGWSITLNDPVTDRIAVQCNFGSVEPLKTVLPGQTARVRGTVDSTYAVLGVKDCRITSVTGEPPPTLVATDLAELFKKEPQALNAKYGGKYLIVTGEIGSVTINEQGAAIIALTKKEDKPEVRCGFGGTTPAEKDRNRAFAKGQKVRVLGYYPRSSDPSECDLSMCQVLSSTP